MKKDFCGWSNVGYQCLSEINIKQNDKNAKIKALGTAINYQQDSKMIHVAAGESDEVFGVEFKPIHKV